MSIPSKSNSVKRTYRSERREQQAAATRRDIVAAAQSLFERDGYVATTMTSIAAEAGVAVETIYRSFEGKAGLIEAVVEAAVAGGAERAERAVEDRPAIRKVIDEPDPRRKLELYAATQPGIHQRSAPLLRALRAGASTDPGLGEVLARLENQRLEGLGRFAQHLKDSGALRRGLSVEAARDLIWTINSQVLFDLLVLEREWSLDRYQKWVALMMIRSLLASDPG
jgi:AcrR family transcriptional regulator